MKLRAFLTTGQDLQLDYETLESSGNWLFLKDKAGKIINAISAQNTSHINFFEPTNVAVEMLPPATELDTDPNATKK